MYKVIKDNTEIKINKAIIFPKPYNEKKIMEYIILTFEEQTIINVKSEIKISSAVIRPLSLNLVPEIINDEIYINITKPVNFSLEINDTSEDNLAVFVNPQREEKGHTIYFGKGVTNAGIIEINKDNTTVFLDKGAYVKGKIFAENCKNLKICGSGIISMEDILWEVPLLERRCIDIHNSTNVNISDIVIYDSVDWSLRIMGCEDVNISNVKVIGSRGNSDGIDICGSRNVEVSDCFLRVWDDALVVKAFNTGDVNNVHFRNCVLWNDFARPIEVGVELRAEKVSNVIFSDIDVIHSTTGYPVMGIHHGDRAVVSNITFRNIRIEDAPGSQLFDIRIVDSAWNRDATKGYIRDINFENIDLIGAVKTLPAKSRLQGFSKDSDIRNITFKNICLLGETVSDLKSLGVYIQDYVENVNVICENEHNPVIPIDTTIKITDDFQFRNGMYYGKVEISAYNNNSVLYKGSMWLDIFPVNTAIYTKEKLEIILAPNSGLKKEFDVVLPPGKYSLVINSNSVSINQSWLFLALDFVINQAVSIVDAPVYSFVNYYHIRNTGIQISAQNDILYLKNSFTKDFKIGIYTTIPVSESENEVKFTVEETDFGEAPAILSGKYGLELAPQLRCPAEITYVFKNQPKVKEIIYNEFENENLIEIPFCKLGLPSNTKNFWLEIELKTNEVANLRYPYTLFHSVHPSDLAHMFANVIIKGV